MRRPGIGEVNLGALSGAVIGAIGGLFAVGLPAAIIYHNPAMLLATPKLNLISFLLSGVSGWLIGGQLGPRVAGYNQRGEVVAGGAAGLIPVLVIALWGWYMVS